MFQKIDAFEYAPHIMKELRGHGALITVTGRGRAWPIP